MERRQRAPVLGRRRPSHGRERRNRFVDVGPLHRSRRRQQQDWAASRPEAGPATAAAAEEAAYAG